MCPLYLEQCGDLKSGRLPYGHSAAGPFQLPETSNPISFGEITSTKWSSHSDEGGDRNDENIQSDDAVERLTRFG